MLGKNEFKLHQYLVNHCGDKTQRIIAEETGMSLGTINALIGEFTSKGYINQDYAVLPDGKKMLEPYRVKNTIIMEAGLSSRFVPISCEKPKGLLEVKGEILIERQINNFKRLGSKTLCSSRLHDGVVFLS